MHGDKDLYFPPDHGRQLYAGAREPKELWLIPGFGHAERATDDKLVDRISAWVVRSVQAGAVSVAGVAGAPGAPGAPGQAVADMQAVADLQAGQEQAATS